MRVIIWGYSRVWVTISLRNLLMLRILFSEVIFELLLENFHLKFVIFVNFERQF